jgi:hypothetical protein
MYTYSHFKVSGKDQVRVAGPQTYDNVMAIEFEATMVDVDNGTASFNSLQITLPFEVWKQVIKKAQEGLNLNGDETGISE